MLTEIHPGFWVDITAVKAVTFKYIDRLDEKSPMRDVAVFFDDSENTLEFKADPEKVIKIINGKDAYMISTRQA
jgi:hypothetical protein